MKSMTGFGKKSIANEEYQVTVEIKAVNHRFLDIQLKLPREYNHLEMEIRRLLKEHFSRGRLECFVTIQTLGEKKKELQVNWGLMDSLVEQLTEASEKRYHSKLDLSPILSGLIKQESFFEVVENDEETTCDVLLLETIGAACVELRVSREVEGAGIQNVLSGYLLDFMGYLKQVKSHASASEQFYRERLEGKVLEILGDAIDESRLLTEVVLLLERGDINEELDRLVIHSNKMKGLLAVSHSVGRELDFVIQEMNREVNTIGSKSTQIEIKESVVQMKTILEKIREQVQNIE
ncbi:YicC family protein [Vagococcus sp. PNs007]|uniref:YicC family protein n=1 Tax=Vagococcus proximus TaxID=2991417 RepID=A0ABT5X3J0_9ENTE|nr:YicC/YloC family endoribonuclease [Vagococcus proximus]MDF0480564.1 YicC family protein [Vagococcus proximus]